MENTTAASLSTFNPSKYKSISKASSPKSLMRIQSSKRSRQVNLVTPLATKSFDMRHDSPVTVFEKP